MSILAVASSIRTTLDFFNMALAITISYYSPTLRLDPFVSNSVSRPFLVDIKGSRWHIFKIGKSSLSVYLVSGSTLERRVPSRREGSYRIIVIFWRNSCKFS